MNKINDGGPAFPAHGSMGEVVCDGMTLRDYFASKEDLSDLQFEHAVCEKILGRKIRAPELDPVGFLEDEAELRAMIKYMRSDAMLAAREVQS